MTELDPQDYFNLIKSRKQETSDKFLTDFQKIVETEMSKAMATKQEFLIRRLAYAYSVISKERELLDLGINIYVMKDDIEEFIKNVSDKVVKVIELEKYPRSIPDEVVEKIQLLREKDIFDRFYVVFTDYTGEVEKQVEVEKRRKDPIIFGAFEQRLEGVWDILDRFYYIADWEDEYCDLTMDKFLQEIGKEKLQTVVIPTNTDEIKEELERLDDNLRRLNDKEFNSLRRNKKFSLKGLFRRNER